MKEIKSPGILFKLISGALSFLAGFWVAKKIIQAKERAELNAPPPVEYTPDEIKDRETYYRGQWSTTVLVVKIALAFFLLSGLIGYCTKMPPL